MSFFDEVETTVANTRYLHAMEYAGPVDLALNDIATLADLEQSLRASVTIQDLIDQPVGFYLLIKFIGDDNKINDVLFLKAVSMFKTTCPVVRKRKVWHVLTRYCNVRNIQVVTNTESCETKKGDTKTQLNVPLIMDFTDYASDNEDLSEREKELQQDSTSSELPADIEELKKLSRQQDPPADMFDAVAETTRKGLEELCAKFKESEQFKKYVQLVDYSKSPITIDDFVMFRVLGRGAFGAVSAVQKIDTGAIYAMKEQKKKMIKARDAQQLCVSERDLLVKVHSPFVLNLKYSFHSEESVYFILDLCSGGDIKFHLHSTESRCFPMERARFYAAEVLLGLEHLHCLQYIYRDIKPENILLTSKGHAKISDLGLAVKVREDKKIKNLAGTAGYWAPEVLSKQGTYYVSDFWGWGVFLYEMICGRRPQCSCKKKTNEWCTFGSDERMEKNALAGGTYTGNVTYDEAVFTPDSIDLLKKIFITDPQARIGAKGIQEIKEHPFFASIDWSELVRLKIQPPYVPEDRTVHAHTIGEVGEFDEDKYKKTTLTEEDQKIYASWNYTSSVLQKELVEALIKLENPARLPQPPEKAPHQDACCILL